MGGKSIQHAQLNVVSLTALSSSGPSLLALLAWPGVDVAVTRQNGENTQPRPEQTRPSPARYPSITMTGMPWNRDGAVLVTNLQHLNVSVLEYARLNQFNRLKGASLCSVERSSPLAGCRSSTESALQADRLGETRTGAAIAARWSVRPPLGKASPTPRPLVEGVREGADGGWIEDKERERESRGETRRDSERRRRRRTTTTTMHTHHGSHA
ncbi:hypothetical protein LZ32DRAFT_604415 [Colletotrichum eremochloae]|nr:hypothetical protein LZ32DRAFT_604415 [Colletotrichum eremochloae]